VLHGSVAWVCRGPLFAVLLAAGASGAQASVVSSGSCSGTSCSRAGTIRWQELLPGGYVVYDDSRGTEPATGEPYDGARDALPDAGVTALRRARG
jgi:hypothetical protein